MRRERAAFWATVSLRTHDCIDLAGVFLHFVASGVMNICTDPCLELDSGGGGGRGTKRVSMAITEILVLGVDDLGSLPPAVSGRRAMVNLEDREKMMTATEHVWRSHLQQSTSTPFGPCSMSCMVIYKPVNLMARSAGMGRRLAGSQLGAAIKPERRVCLKDGLP